MLDYQTSPLFVNYVQKPFSDFIIKNKITIGIMIIDMMDFPIF